MTVFPVPATGKGCSGESAAFYPAEDVVRRRAETDLSCAASELVIQRHSDTELSVSGCGKSEDYVCEADAVSGCSLDDAAAREGCRSLEEIDES